ncbi:MAG: hypothetical protein A2096_09700 [Spirochaetes bacterium GWF1_41_5]|nr:MAG: hypothetical protein A2096_09700 [Spirochaetes bacterium GWF1_41_5]
MFCGSYVFLLPFFLLSFGVLFYRGNKFQRFKLLYFLCLIGIFITSRASVQRFFIGLNMIFMLSVPICADLLPPRIQLIMNKISAGLVAGVILLIVFFNINQVQQKLVKICRYSYSLEEKKICDLIDHLPPGEKLYIDKKLRLNTNEFPIKPRYEKIKIIDIINDYHTIPARSQLCSLYIFDDAYRQAFGLAEAGKAGSDFNAFYNNDNIKSVPYRVLLYPHNMRLSIMQPRSQQLKFFRLREKLPLSPFTVDTGKSCVFPAAFLKTGGLFIQEWGYQLTTFSRTNRTVFYLEKILKFRAGKYKICLKAFSNIKDRESQARVFINGRCIAQTELDTTSEVKKQYRILTYLPDFAARWRNKYYPRDIAGTHDFPVNGIYTIGMEIYCCSKETGLRINELEITPCR